MYIQINNTIIKLRDNKYRNNSLPLYDLKSIYIKTYNKTEICKHVYYWIEKSTNVNEMQQFKLKSKLPKKKKKSARTCDILSILEPHWRGKSGKGEIISVCLCGMHFNNHIKLFTYTINTSCRTNCRIIAAYSHCNCGKDWRKWARLHVLNKSYATQPFLDFSD